MITATRSIVLSSIIIFAFLAVASSFQLNESTHLVYQGDVLLSSHVPSEHVFYYSLAELDEVEEEDKYFGDIYFSNIIKLPWPKIKFFSNLAISKSTQHSVQILFSLRSLPPPSTRLNC